MDRMMAGRMPDRYLMPNGNIDTAKLKAELSISKVAAEATSLVSSGGELKGLCPFHDEDHPSFFVNERKGVFNCFGCGCGGDTIHLQALLHQQSFYQACVALADGETAAPKHALTPKQWGARKALARRRAREEWQRATAIEGTLGETYLMSRGISHGIPSTVRFSRIPRFWHDDGREGPRQPAMLAAAQDAEGRVCGIQRTFLDGDGRKVRDREPRLSLGRMRGTALRLGPIMPKIMLASAVEDALSLRLMFPGATVWSAFGDANLPQVELPRGIWHVTVCGDDDEPGRAAVAATRETMRTRGIETDELFPRAAKDFNEEWVLLHA